MVLRRVLLRTPLREANVTAAPYAVSLFLFKVLKGSFDRTLVAELTPEALFLKPLSFPSEPCLGSCASLWHFTTSLGC